jgi:hypothetical protein
MYAVFGNSIIGEVECIETASATNYSLFLMSVASFMIELTPSLIEYRFSTCGCFFELIFDSSYLNIFAFSESSFSPVSWHRALNSSEWWVVVHACSSFSNTKKIGFLTKMSSSPCLRMVVLGAVPPPIPTDPLFANFLILIRLCTQW